jgi:ATP-dependent Clp protease ATP-binding subunit ClpC
VVRGERVQVFPGARPVSVEVAAVYGRMASGVWLCSLPQVEQVFYFYDKASLKDLVVHTVQESFKGRPAHQVYLSWAPEPPHLEQIVLQVRTLKPRPGEYALDTVRAVAEPVADLRPLLARAYEREDVVADVVARLSKEKASLVLVGPAGCGKTAVLVDAVRQVERQGSGRRFWLTRGARLISGMRYLGMWQERCEAIVAELSDAHAVLCVESLLELVSAGGSATDGVGAFLVPYLQRGELRLVAEATPEELDAVRRLLPGLSDALQVVPIRTMPEAQALRALEHVVSMVEQKHRVNVQSRVREQVVALLRRFMPYRPLPGAATAFIRRLVEETRGDVTTDDVFLRFILDTGLPERLVRDDVALSSGEVVSALQVRVMGQDEACRQVSRAVVRFKAGLNDPRRPLGVFLFSGPTGVGKTELARALADYLFGHGEKEERLVRLDMSEYSTWGAEQRLQVDAHGEPSAFIRRVRQQPFVVVLLDEIEKATPAVFDVLLSMLDEGRLTDSLGRVTTFCSALVVMTSNVGQTSKAPIGLTTRAPDEASSAVARFFRPEFFNRLDAVVGFSPLSPTLMRDIVLKELRLLAQREGFKSRRLQVTFTPDLVEHLATAGYDPRYGARPLQRLLETSVVVPCSRFLVDHPAVRDDTLRVSRTGVTPTAGP